MPGKIGRTSEQRMALLRNQASELLWYGKIKTTEAKAKQLQPYVEKIITKAMSVYDLNEETEIKKKDAKGKEVKVELVNDGPKKLAARRAIMKVLYDIPELRQEKETPESFRARTHNIKHPLVEKIFNEYAPKYDERAKNSNNNYGGYTRVIKTGFRRGDAAEMAIIELV